MKNELMSQRVLFVAPCHILSDERVLRSIRCARTAGAECFLAVDYSVFSECKRNPGSRDAVVADNVFKGVKLISLRDCSSNKSIARLQRLVYAPSFAGNAQILRPDIVHVHESGVLGLFLSFLFKLVYPRTRVYFDYHDWIPYELSVFVRHSRILYALLLPILVAACRFMASRLDGVVAISEGQARWIREQLGVAKTFVVPNVRPLLDFPALRDGLQASSFSPALLFVGNVMRSRKLEAIIDLISGDKLCPYKPVFHIVGTCADKEYCDLLDSYARSKGVASQVLFHGSYASDFDIRPLVKPGMLAYLLPLTFGSDPSAIESIASSNKFFTYATLGLPLFLHSSYVDMSNLLAMHRAGFTFDALTDLAALCARIWDSSALWHELSEGSRSIALHLNNETIDENLSQLYR